MFMALETTFYEARDMTTAPEACSQVYALTDIQQPHSVIRIDLKAKYGIEHRQTRCLVAGI